MQKERGLHPKDVSDIAHWLGRRDPLEESLVDGTRLSGTDPAAFAEFISDSGIVAYRDHNRKNPI